MRKAAGPAVFRHILCPIDFSRHSRTALRYAAELAERRGSRLTVLFVNDPLLDAAAAAAAYDTKRMAADTLIQMRRFVTSAGIAVDVSLATAEGHAAPAILKTTRRAGADLIVMGSHGLSGPRKWLIGSATEQVLRRSAVPVLIVPHRLSKAESRLGPGARVVVAVDLADYTAADVRAVREVLTAFDAKPLFLHVMRPTRVPGWFKAADTMAADAGRARAALEKLARGAGAQGECQLVIGDPADEIAAAAASAKARLIVLKLRRSPGPFGPRRGSITYGVACRGVAPVLAIPEPR